MIPSISTGPSRPDIRPLHPSEPRQQATLKASTVAGCFPNTTLSSMLHRHNLRNMVDGLSAKTVDFFSLSNPKDPYVRAVIDMAFKKGESAAVAGRNLDFLGAYKLPGSMFGRAEVYRELEREGAQFFVKINNGETKGWFHGGKVVNMGEPFGMHLVSPDGIVVFPSGKKDPAFVPAPIEFYT